MNFYLKKTYMHVKTTVVAGHNMTLPAFSQERRTWLSKPNRSHSNNLGINVLIQCKSSSLFVLFLAKRHVINVSTEILWIWKWGIRAIASTTHPQKYPLYVHGEPISKCLKVEIVEFILMLWYMWIPSINWLLIKYKMIKQCL